jgi:O-acetyl-ADP-ribose deacetylase (regulator of RNase III)
MSKVTIESGDMFASQCQGIVCPTNSFGVMGAGLAKKFKGKQVFQEGNEAYNKISRSGGIAPGSCWPYLYDSEKCLWVIYFATKFHFSEESKMDYIENGLINLKRSMAHFDIKSVALPAVGCGLGGLPYPSVELFVKEIFENDGSDNLVELYQPK